MQVDYLIIGQGICGTFLSYYLTKENKNFIVIDKQELITPSKVSAGIINPVTGRRMVKVWMAEQVLSFAHDAYTEIGNFLGVKAISQKNIIDFFPNPHQRLVFLERIEEGDPYLHSYPEQNQFNQFFRYDFGCGEIRHSYIAHLDILLPAWREQLKTNKQLLEENFEFENLATNERSILYKNITAQKIIFCDGLSSFQNPFFRQLPFAPNKGEVLIIEIPDLPVHYIYKKGFIVAPLSAGNLFWFGSNYQWNFPDPHPTKEFYEQGERHLKSWLKLPFKILEHKGAIRPATLERRPFVGFHPHQENIAILNGMGTKGCSLAPYFANQLVRQMIHYDQIDPLANISRFQKILSLQ
jgi:glycine/D-amino acid oxidase-like deaminating enzyme